jgi:hypothetical protein
MEKHTISRIRYLPKTYVRMQNTMAVAQALTSWTTSATNSNAICNGRLQNTMELRETP